jgi:hypothetical protein
MSTTGAWSTQSHATMLIVLERQVAARLAVPPNAASRSGCRLTREPKTVAVRPHAGRFTEPWIRTDRRRDRVRPVTDRAPTAFAPRISMIRAAPATAVPAKALSWLKSGQRPTYRRSSCSHAWTMICAGSSSAFRAKVSQHRGPTGLGFGTSREQVRGLRGDVRAVGAAMTVALATARWRGVHQP